MLLLKVLNGGHLSFDWTRVGCIDNPGKEEIFPAETSGGENKVVPGVGPKQELTEERFFRVHRHTGHCDVSSIQKLCASDGIAFDVDKGRLWIQKCSCGRDDRIPQNPKISRRVSSFPGEVIEIDISYPKEE